MKWLRAGGNLLSIGVLVAVNALPLIGVAFWGWSLMMILVLYWLESGIVGVINIFKIARAAGEGGPPVTINGNRVTIRMSGMASGMGKGVLIGFFVMHYGIFWAVHGVFVFLMPVIAGAATIGSNGFGFAPADFGPLPIDGLVFAFALLAASHVLSYVTNYVGRGEYLHATPAGQMMSVYGRVIVLHVTIVCGAFVIAIFGTPFAALVLLVVLKTIVDLVLHVVSHRSTPSVATA